MNPGGSKLAAKPPAGYASQPRATARSPALLIADKRAQPRALTGRRVYLQRVRGAAQLQPARAPAGGRLWANANRSDPIRADECIRVEAMTRLGGGARALSVVESDHAARGAGTGSDSCRSDHPAATRVTRPLRAIAQAARRLPVARSALVLANKSHGARIDLTSLQR